MPALAKMRASNTAASSSSSSNPNSHVHTAKMSWTPSTAICMSLWLLPLLLLAVLQQPCECRYLPTRSHGDDLDKLRELMLQILESSNEEQRPPPNELSGGNNMAQQGNWLSKLNALDVPRKYGGRGYYEGGHYY